jgi:anthranilate phosphoribosyltransferase
MGQPNKRVSEVLHHLYHKQKIPLTMLKKAFLGILSNPNIVARDVQLGALLTGIMVKGPTCDEVEIMIRTALSVDKFSLKKKIIIELPKNKLLIGVAGSGKKSYKTVNISTPAALTAASLGAYTAKIISYSTSSKSGSADLLELLGVNIHLTTEKMIEVLRKTYFGGFLIEGLIPLFDKVYGGKFFSPHALSFGLAGLVTPIKFDSILYGLTHNDVELSMLTLAKFGIRNGIVVSTQIDNGYFIDEFTSVGATRMIEMKNNKIGKVINFNSKQEFQLPQYSYKQLSEAKTVSNNIKKGLSVLLGKGEKAIEDTVALNSGAILYLSKMTESIKEGYFLAKEAIKKKLPYEKLLEIIKLTGGDINKHKKFIKEY